jgi:hypothetical protein
MNYSLLLKSQIYYLTNIVFILTIIYKKDIRPLNLFVLLVSIYYLHIKTDFYANFHKKIPKKILVLHDVIFHWGPFLYTLNQNDKNDKTNWFICIIVLLLYSIFAIKHLNNIYFDVKTYYRAKK